MNEVHMNISPEKPFLGVTAPCSFSMHGMTPGIKAREEDRSVFPRLHSTVR
jgi:hypothetical protein